MHNFDRVFLLLALRCGCCGDQGVEHEVQEIFENQRRTSSSANFNSGALEESDPARWCTSSLVNIMPSTHPIPLVRRNCCLDGIAAVAAVKKANNTDLCDDDDGDSLFWVAMCML